MLDLFSDIFELIHETGLNCIFYKFNGPLQADFTADTNYILIMFDLWIIHFFEMDSFFLVNRLNQFTKLVWIK